MNESDTTNKRSMSGKVAGIVLLASVLGFTVVFCLRPYLLLRLGNRIYNVNGPDALLVDRVFQAVDLGIPAEEAEAFVGRATAINTVRDPGDRDVFEFADICNDDMFRGQGNLAFLIAGVRNGSVRHFMWWIRPTASRNPELIGIFWTADGQFRVVHGTVLPPG